jgi:hypothetical protein
VCEEFSKKQNNPGAFERRNNAMRIYDLAGVITHLCSVFVQGFRVFELQCQRRHLAMVALVDPSRADLVRSMRRRSFTGNALGTASLVVDVAGWVVALERLAGSHGLRVEESRSRGALEHG